MRTYLTYMWTHPGKKLLFMGTEFAQGREWNYQTSLDWHLLDTDWHKQMQGLVRALNHLYRDHPALHARDCESDGFSWIDCTDHENSVLAYVRRESDAPDAPVVLVVVNLTPIVREDYRIGAPSAGWYAEILNTDSAEFGGSDVTNGRVVTLPQEAHGHPQSLMLTLPPLAAVVLRPGSRTPEVAGRRRSGADRRRRRALAAGTPWARPSPTRVGFAVAAPRMPPPSRSACSTAPTVRKAARLTLPARDPRGIWHGHVAGLKDGQLYGLRVHGPYDPVHGHRHNPHKLLVDPWAREVVGRVRPDDATFGFTRDGPDADLTFDERDSAPFMPRCVARRPAGRARPAPARPGPTPLSMRRTSRA